MRVTGGALRGRKLRVPPRGVRPTQDKVREALFAILGDRVRGARFLDLCAGSGAVGLEAWSRGADFVCWVEINRHVFSGLRANVEACCSEGIRLVQADAGRVLKPGFTEEPFDLVFADPPYSERHQERRRSLIGRIFQVLADGSIMRKNGILVIEQGSESPAFACSGWILTEDRNYGRSTLCFYQMK